MNVTKNCLAAVYTARSVRSRVKDHGDERYFSLFTLTVFYLGSHSLLERRQPAVIGGKTGCAIRTWGDCVPAAGPLGAARPSPVQVTVLQMCFLFNGFHCREFLYYTALAVLGLQWFSPMSPRSVLCSCPGRTRFLTRQPSLSRVLLCPALGSASRPPQPFLLSVAFRPSPIVGTLGHPLVFL